MKKVVIVSCVFPPEPVVSAKTSADLAKHLAISDTQVKVITSFPNRPSGKLYPGYRRKFVQKDLHPDGYEVFRCYSLLSSTSTMKSRFLENISFGLSSALILLFMQKPDVIYANTWPIFAIGLITFVAWLRRVPILISVQDIYPESLIAQGRIPKDGLRAKIFNWIDAKISRSATKIILISEKFIDFFHFHRRIPYNKIVIIPNWIDRKLIDHYADGNIIRQKLKIPQDAFVCGYAGNIGKAAGVEEIIRAFSKAIDRPNLFLLIAGDGPNLENCETLTKLLKVDDRIFFYSPWPEDETSEVLMAIDLFFLPTIGNQSLVSVPSKLMTYQLAGKPIVAIVLPESETANLVNLAKSGWVIGPEDQEGLVRIIQHVQRMDKSELEIKGNDGREYILRNLVSEICVPRLAGHLIQASQTRKI